ncbi:hypothetical protein, partial [Sulfitobacter sp.]|uniref:hypothetical protein n=1 Tax=Sulfitobacter sp. TaxID=1903071 RepID=UPI00300303EC
LSGSGQAGLNGGINELLLYMVFAHASSFSTYDCVTRRPCFPSFFVVCIRNENQPVRMLLVFLALVH